MSDKQRSLIRSLWSALALASLAFAQPFTYPEVPTYPGTDVPFPEQVFDNFLDPDGEVLFDGLKHYQTERRCLAHEGTLPGQTMFISGSTLFISGSAGPFAVGTDLMYEANGVTTQVEARPPSYYLGQPPAAAGVPTLAELLGPTDAAEGDVVIFVADDFSGGHFRLPSEVLGFDRFSLTAAELEDLVNKLSNGDVISHGASVLHHLNSLVAATGHYEPVDLGQTHDGTHVWRNTDSSAKLVLRALDLSQQASAGTIDTADIATALVDGIRGAWDELAGLDVQASAYVINLSWVLLPCKTVADFIADRGIGRFATFGDYLGALADRNPDLEDELATGEGFAANLARILTWVGPEDGLHELVNGDERVNLFEAGGARRFAVVAAAGNFSLPYQMFPADWPFVVGAGAADYPQSQRRYSNVADVVVPGEWFQLVREDDSPVELSYAGTSYSAPAVSLFTAINLVSAGQGAHCAGTGLADLPGLSPLKTGLSPDAWLGDAALTGCDY